MALTPWLGRPIRVDQGLHSVRLDSRGAWPYRLVAFSSTGWHSFTRAGAPWPAHSAWAQRTRTIDRPRWMDVKPVYMHGLNPMTPPLNARVQYRKAQPAKKTYALAAALRQSAEAIAARRG